ncbi:MAG: peptidoglycan DD-metalloendopeptidase family protein [Simkaniaceae bacterium]|nr:peptidoglycan DD-metalloendopeptidase family protein [Candidatus Sacchlamyda saccharinae]
MEILTAENCIFLSLAIISVEILITSLENLVNWKIFGSKGILNWEVSHLTTKWSSKGNIARIINFILDDAGFRYFLLMQCMLSFILFFLSCIKILAPSLLLLELILLLVFSFRTLYGLDGAYHMSIVVLGALTLASFFGIESKISLICIWFVAGQLMLSYFISGIRKLQSPIWRSGEALYLIFRTNAFGHKFAYKIVKKNRVVRFLLSWSVIVFETLFPLALILDFKIALIFFGVALTFHIMTAIFMGLNNFLLAFASAYPLAIFCLQSPEIYPLLIPTIFYAIIPVLLIFWLWNHSLNSYKALISRTSVIGLYFFNLALGGLLPFVGFGYYSRQIFLILFFSSIIFSFYKLSKNKNQKKEEVSLPKKQFSLSLLKSTLLMAFAALMSYEIVCSFKGRQTSIPGIELEFPLKNGTFYISQGGNHQQMNHHYIVPGQKFALDIVKINALGFRSNSLIPSRMEDYNIFGTEVHSPINGHVVRVNDGIEDLTPPQVNPSSPAGNYILIKPENSDKGILLAHLRCNSILVKEEDYVHAGQQIGIIGNSGNTSEPHLHIHCIRLDGREDFLFEAESIPMRFGNKFLARNSIIRN